MQNLKSRRPKLDARARLDDVRTRDLRDDSESCSYGYSEVLRAHRDRRLHDIPYPE